MFCLVFEWYIYFYFFMKEGDVIWVETKGKSRAVSDPFRFAGFRIEKGMNLDSLIIVLM